MKNNSPCKIADIGKVKIKMFDGVIRTLSEVRHILDLTRNFISFEYSFQKYIGIRVKLKFWKKARVPEFVSQGSTITLDTTVTKL